MEKDMNRTNSFETKNMIFRPIEIDDLNDIFHIYSDPEVVRLDQSEPIKDIEQAERIISIAEKSNQNPQRIVWGGQLKDSNRLIGTCGFKNWDRISRHAEIGGNLSSAFWGKGFAKEAVVALLSYGFQHMELNKVYANTNSKNSRATRLLTHYGFTHEGILREHHFIEGEFVNVNVYSLLKKEWNEIKGHL